MLLLFILQDLVFGNWGVDWKKLWHPVTLFWNDEAKMTAVVISCVFLPMAAHLTSFSFLGSIILKSYFQRKESFLNATELYYD